MSDRVFYTLYRFFECVHGRGDAAEVAALVTWCFLLIFNLATIAVLLIVIAGNAQPFRSYVLNGFTIAGVIIAVSQYLRYLGGDRLKRLCDGFRDEPSIARTQRRWLSFGYSSASLVMLSGSLWLLSAVA